MRQLQPVCTTLESSCDVGYTGRYYEYAPNQLVGTTLKVGHNSLAKMAKREGWKTKDRDDEELLMLVRDPMDRLRSAYQFFTQRLQCEQTWEEFVDNILAGNRNNHWIPQTVHHENPTRYMEFDKFLDVQENASKEVDVPWEYRYEELLEYYEDDWKLWTDLTT